MRGPSFDVLKELKKHGVEIIPCHALEDQRQWCDYNPRLKKVSKGGFMGHTCSLQNGTVHYYNRPIQKSEPPSAKRGKRT